MDVGTVDQGCRAPFCKPSPGQPRAGGLTGGGPTDGTIRRRDAAAGVLLGWKNQTNRIFYWRTQMHDIIHQLERSAEAARLGGGQKYRQPAQEEQADGP